MVARYPLGSLEALRKSRVEERERALHEQRDRVAAARLECERLARERAALEALGRRVRVEELERLGIAGAKASDLSALSAWTDAHDARLKALEQHEDRARAHLAEELTKEAALRSELSRADADAKAVELHHQHWQEERERHAELMAEEQAADLHGSRRPEP